MQPNLSAIDLILTGDPTLFERIMADPAPTSGCVIGLDALRVADASIMPTIAEKVAAMIREGAGR